MSKTVETIRQHSWVRLALQGLTVAIIAGLLGLLVRQTVAKDAGPRLVSEVKAGTNPSAPEFELPLLWAHAETWPESVRSALSDGRVSLRELRGHPVVVNFWASWCVPCKAEAPRLVASARAHAGRVAFIGVDVQDFKSDARRFLTRYGTNYVSVRDGDDSTSSAYGVTGIPETYYLDARGRIVAHSVGEVSRQELKANVNQAIEESR
jgi:cytochrome c biogenesis protein CcmG, thiol:disulfide interchange protein DsbE